MSVLIVGVSHNSAPVSLLERLAAPGADAVHKLVSDAAGCAHVAEATVISTCNRLEIYADVERFHGSVEQLSTLLVERSGVSTEALLPHLYVHYDDGAVAHLFQVAAGLDSMAVGEGQILGQTREALRLGQELGTVGPALNVLFQQALRVGKRSRGAMAGLATATVSRLGAADIVVLNRTPERAERLAAEYAGRPAPVESLASELAGVDLLITCTGATGVQVDADLVRAARPDGRPLAIIDLALPHDVDPAAAEVPGVTLVNLAELAAGLHESEAGVEIAAVRSIVTEEVSAFLTARRQASVTPTVVALRSMATSVGAAEMARLDGRLPDLDPTTRAEVLHAVRRVADKLLHEPTVRVRELANETGAVSYAAALAELFALDPDAVTAVTSPAVPEEKTR